MPSRTISICYGSLTPERKQESHKIIGVRQNPCFCWIIDLFKGRAAIQCPSSEHAVIVLAAVGWGPRGYTELF
jgi:hypothetical protein